MILLDVNVLVYAHHEGAPDHARYKKWLKSLVSGNESFGVTDLVFSGFLRIITHPAIFDPPGNLERALEFIDFLKRGERFVPVAPGELHWGIFEKLCRESKARGNLVSDAYHAACAVENVADWVTTDRDYRRFKGLKTRHPLQDR